ncbi:MAG: multidrug efflux RND transporter permease subunit [Endomicrobia bacterium]|nr:multidrug efflux RND transporter permease subunit [Endomicrobiia bacterium]MCL2506371.1 multidrug efflux RND transporter permease subunit [Endomicrobiia bacterium]
MLSKFFIERPIFATVISLLILMAGILSIFSLSVDRYPNLTPPTVVVSAVYSGADPEVISETVAAPLEQQINGVENMMYMNSVSDAYGNMTLSIYFNIGTDPNQATIDVNNLVQQALPLLPQEVQRSGVRVTKKSMEMLQIYSISSPDNLYDATYMANYALVNVVDELKRIEGVGDAQVLSANTYAMRIWLNPDKLAQHKLTPSDIIAAVSIQNQQRAAGIIGEAPMTDKVSKTFTIKAQGRYQTPEQFEQIILRANADGSTLLLKDVADIELGPLTYSFHSTINKQPAVPVAIFMEPGANAVATAKRAQAVMDSVSKRFPEGMTYQLAYDTTSFITESIKEVVKTLLIAVLLVFLVVFLFLQNWRATLIPCVVVPISIIGAFAGIYALGFSINTLTLFGLVLAIGMVVDDAIVVIENVERIMRVENLLPKEAAIKAMSEVQSALIAIVFVLCSVFIPISFMGGFAGVMYQQFAITIAISVVISGWTALTLTPALCAILLKKKDIDPKGLFKKFNLLFEATTNKYVSIAGFFIRRLPAAIVVMSMILFLSVFMFKKIPSNLVPNEDQGAIMVAVEMDPGTSLDASLAMTAQVEQIILDQPAVNFELFFTGRDLLSGAQKPNAAASYIKLKPWNQRTSKALSVDAAIANIQREAMMKVPGALVMAFNPPPIMGLSTTGGLEGYIQNRGNSGTVALSQILQEFIEAVKKRPEIAGINTTFSNIVPQYKMTVDNVKAVSKGVSLDDLYITMQATFGSYYVNDFTKFERSFNVMVQAAAEYRKYPEQINGIFVRSSKGEMIPLSELIKFEPVLGSDSVERFNVFPAAKIIAVPAAGISEGTAIQILEEIALKVLGQDFALAWTGATYQEKLVGNASFKALLLGIIVIFLILAAQYENWSLPFVVILAVPFAIFGALLGTFLRGLENDIYFQIALVALVGLAAKNAILIVEFAVQLKKQGLDTFNAALQAAKLRFRPIIMTSLAFILGTLPLAISTGAGANSRHSIGTAVVCGMLGATIIAPLLIPLFFYLIEKKKNNNE